MMMNAMLVSFGNGMVTGTIDWPVDGLLTAIVLTLAFVLLLMGLLHERAPNTVVRSKPTRLRPSLPSRVPQQQAA